MSGPTSILPAGPLASLDYAVLQQCIHCGACLAVCPTYAATRHERHSPRGRVALMRAIADGDLTITTAFGEEMYFCLGCLACTSACPAGVDYDHLFEVARAEVERARVLSSPKRNAVRWIVLRVIFTRPRLLRALGRLLWLYQASGAQALVRRIGLTRLLPWGLCELEPQAPAIGRHFSDALIRETEPAHGERRFRVALLTGCVQDLAFAAINRATADVLQVNGCEVFTPRLQGCCGSLHAHNGDTRTAQATARRLIDLIDPFAVDAIISNAGGCGSHLRHYDRLLAGDPRYAERAVEWSRKLRDIHEWLVEIRFRHPGAAPAAADRPTPSDKLTVTYHESCHLSHSQKVTSEPREILNAIPGLRLCECPESNWCCGSAGIYNITQPRTAAWLQRRKLRNISATGATVVAVCNPGCHIQLENGLRASGNSSTVVTHPITLLAAAYRRERPDQGTGDLGSLS